MGVPWRRYRLMGGYFGGCRGRGSELKKVATGRFEVNSSLISSVAANGSG
jgi:hypothetical protein